MASNECSATFSATEETLILHSYGLEVVTMAKRVLISLFLLRNSKTDMKDFLKQTFTSKKQIIPAPYYGGNAFTLDDIPFVISWKK